MISVTHIIRGLLTHMYRNFVCFYIEFLLCGFAQHVTVFVLVFSFLFGILAHHHLLVLIMMRVSNIQQIIQWIWIVHRSNFQIHRAFVCVLVGGNVG